MKLNCRLDDVILGELCRIRYNKDWGARPSDIAGRTWNISSQDIEARLRELVAAGVVEAKTRQEGTAGILVERFLLAPDVVICLERKET